ncbi:MAG: ACT domain-containing protein [Calditrichaceae bacterium]
MKISGLVEQGNLTMYTIKSIADQPGVAGKILNLLAKAQINLEFITEISYRDRSAVMSFCINADLMDATDKLIQETVEVKSVKIDKNEYVTILGVYGPHFREKPGIAAIFCSLLGEAGVNILGISSSISTISCLIDVRDFEKAKSLLLTYFELP